MIAIVRSRLKIGSSESLVIAAQREASGCKHGLKEPHQHRIQEALPLFLALAQANAWDTRRRLTIYLLG